MKMAIFYLTCKDDWEADRISKVLIDKKLVICAKQVPVNSSYLWKGKRESANEVLVMFESVEENFEKVNKEIKKLHSYETYVLYSTSVKQTTKEGEKWLEDEL